jgi:hypothetical protein
MKINWKATAASLAVLVGISGVAFGQDRDDHRDRDNHARVENHDRDHDRDQNNRGWNNGRVYVPDNRRVYNNGWYGDRDHDRDRNHDRDRDRVVYNGGAYSPYYGYSNGGYGR